MTVSGLTRLARESALLSAYAGRGDRLGLVANPSAQARGFVPAHAVLARACEKTGCSLVRLFGPEHGFYGEAQAGQRVPDSVDKASGIPVVSLYNESKRPRKESLSGLDLLVYDLQDVGLRWYTYLGTLTRILETLAELKAEGRPYPRVLVLDRPNPLSGAIVEGPGLVAGFESLVGPYDLPIRHGLSLGEYARMRGAGLGLSVDALAVEGWSRGMGIGSWKEAWIPPSPNLPSLASLPAYALSCLLEGTNVSEGRGTANPFEMLGAPWVSGPELREAIDALGIAGLSCRPVFFVPSFSKYQGQRCEGVQLYIDPDSPAFARLIDIAFELLTILRALYPRDFEFLPPWSPGAKRPISLLWGSDDLADGSPGERPSARYGDYLRAYEMKRRPFLLYS
ncbi:MAG TPA: DUF1343 domain-containing protein [Spirochaetaceae bacterium]|jgi:uncharacterized protein YbbC (DUF1343 family)|nr:DUF1343 domain-containing protein [Spirochaetaceae bacterium]